MMKKLIALLLIAIPFSITACNHSQDSTILCNECSSIISENSKFCSSCGASVNEIDSNMNNLLEKDTSTSDWDRIFVKTILPEPKSKNRKISKNETDYLYMYVYDTSFDDYTDYISSCVDMGYDRSEETEENEYIAYNRYHSRVDIYYDSENKMMRVQLSAQIENNPLQWSNSELAQLLPVPSTSKGYIDADKEEKYEVILMDVSTTDFNDYVTECIEKGFTIDSQRYATYYRAKNENGYRVTLEFNETDREMGITVIVPEN